MAVKTLRLKILRKVIDKTPQKNHTTGVTKVQKKHKKNCRNA